MNDYYKTLGVHKSANHESIKVAYKTLAKKFHPDMHHHSVGGSDEERMKKVNEAWSVLQNPSRRAAYDASLKDSEDHIYPKSKFSYKHYHSSSEQIAAEIRLTLEEAIIGTEKDIELQFLKDCSWCGTTGHLGTQRKICLFCFGSGMAFGQPHKLCRACGGRGWDLQMQICPSCSGHGTKLIREKVRLRIPAGIFDHDILHVNCNGERLGIRFFLKPSKKFERKDTTLLTRRSISPKRAQKGTTVTISPPGKGKLKIKVPPGCADGTILKITGKGLVSRKGVGDILVVINIKKPDRPSKT
jgi:molecular chaperone DnaJ